MKDYRKLLLEHFDSKPTFSFFLAFDILITAAGLLLLIAGKICLLIPKAISLYYIFPAFGQPLFLFGLVLSFIKNDNLCLATSLALFSLLRFICVIVVLFKYNLALLYAPLIEFLIAAFLLFLTLKKSTVISDISKIISNTAEAQKKVREEKKKLAVAEAVEADFEPEPVAESFISNNCYCHVCGATLAPDARFCEICGTSFTDAEVNYCPDCGSPYREGQKFCDLCGHSLP